MSELSSAEAALFVATARWLEESISRPHSALGRSGDVCPWTRRALQLNRLFLASVPATEQGCIDSCVLSLLQAFHGLGEVSGNFDAHRAIVAVFPRLPRDVGDQTIVETHARLKPTFLRHRMMLGEFYPTCEKPGLHSAAFRPLRAPHPLLVIRAMVEPDIVFLTDRDEFVDAYLAALGDRGVERLNELLAAPSNQLPADRLEALRGRVAGAARRCGRLGSETDAGAIE